MEGEGSGKKASSDRSRRPWSDVEERILLECMKDIVKRHWKCDNGFKAGYQKVLEQMMAKQLPKSGIRATPHINSKITMWKRLYGSLRTMLGDSSSGIGFNTSTAMIDCDDEQWARVLKNDPAAVNMRMRSWPMYEDWVEIFGNDRATGSTAENVYSAYNNVVEEEIGKGVPPVDLTEDSTDGFTGFTRNEYNMGTQDFCDMDEDSQAKEPETPPTVRPNQRKRSASVSSPADPLVEVLGKLATSSDERVGQICRAIGYEAELGKSRQDLFCMLDGIPGLSLDGKIDVAKVLAKDSGTMEMFLGFSTEARVRFVERLLSGDGV